MAKMDLRQEVMARLSDPETRQRIADALILEATGGPPDPKSGVPKGGATVIRAFELIREIALERVPNPAAESDFSRYADAELIATLARLETEERTGGGATGRPSGQARSPPGRGPASGDALTERGAASGDAERERAPPGDGYE